MCFRGWGGNPAPPPGGKTVSSPAAGTSLRQAHLALGEETVALRIDETTALRDAANSATRLVARKAVLTGGLRNEQLGCLNGYALAPRLRRPPDEGQIDARGLKFSPVGQRLLRGRGETTLSRRLGADRRAVVASRSSMSASARRALRAPSRTAPLGREVDPRPADNERGEKTLENLALSRSAGTLPHRWPEVLLRCAVARAGDHGAIGMRYLACHRVGEAFVASFAMSRA
jgi:hypothetical protein